MVSKSKPYPVNDSLLRSAFIWCYESYDVELLIYSPFKKAIDMSCLLATMVQEQEEEQRT